MTDITQCPKCGTHFKITEAQRNAHQGKVRCGKCQTVFNAAGNLYTPPQQLALPLVMDEIADVTGLHKIYDPYAENNYAPAPVTAETAARMANDFRHIPDVYIASSPNVLTPRQSRLLGLASVLLGIVLLLQTVYFFRVEIAARLPGLKPGMLKVCAAIKCNLPLPQKLDLISIESSELESDPAQEKIVTLHALLKSNAPYAMTYPHIELTLTDLKDNAIARRSFTPENYLPTSIDIKSGYPANREININLHLDTTDLKPAGYRLILFYPAAI